MNDFAMLVGINGSTVFRLPINHAQHPVERFSVSGFWDHKSSWKEYSFEKFLEQLVANCPNVPDQISLVKEEVYDYVSFVWFSNAKFTDILTFLEVRNLAPANLTHALALGHHVRMVGGELQRTYHTRIANTTLYVLGSNNLISIQDNKILVGEDMDQVLTNKSKPIFPRPYWVMVIGANKFARQQTGFILLFPTRPA